MLELSARCAVCGLAIGQHWFRTIGDSSRKHSVDFWRCDACGLIYRYPLPPTAALASLYEDPDYQSHSSAAENPRAWWYRTARALCVTPYRMMHGPESYLPSPWGTGVLLDVGCGVGDYLRVMTAKGWECYGCDLSAAAVAKATAIAPRATVHCGPLENAFFLSATSFQLITFWHSLEHLPDPLSTLIRVRQCLAPDGRLVVAVPNVASIEARLLGQHWLAIDLFGHLYFFSPASLTHLLERAGYTVDGTRPQLHASSVSDAIANMVARRADARVRSWLYYGFYAPTCLSYVLGNWGCIETQAVPA